MANINPMEMVHGYVRTVIPHAGEMMVISGCPMRMCHLPVEMHIFMCMIRQIIMTTIINMMVV